MSSLSSPISSRNSVPPSASWNLPRCLSVAPVKAPFSWPNRMLSIRFSGMAPQFTVTKGFPARSEPPWIARATSSLPTPDSPSIRIGMEDCDARVPRRITCRMARVFPDHSVKPEPVLLLLLEPRYLSGQHAELERVRDRDFDALRTRG